MSGRAQPLPPLQGGMLVIATIGISVVTAMTVLDSTIANVALPTIAGNLGVASSQGTWVITFFGVANAIAIPLTGWLARRMGEVRLYFWSTFLFVVASFLCGISSSLGMLIICRILQGAAAGPLIPLSQSLLLACYPREKRGIALSLWSMTIVLAPILGPILGGYICDNYTWNWIFFVNVPVGAVCLVALRIPMAGRETATAKNPIDTVGLILLIIGVGCLQLMLDEGKDKDWFASGYIVILGVLTVVGLVLLVAWELTEEHPVVDLSLFRHRNFTVGTICISLGFLFYFAGVVMMPMMLQTRLGYTSMWAGLSLAPIGIFPVFLSPLIGRFAQRIDMRVIVTMSFLVFSAAFYLRTLFSPDVDFAFVLWPQVVQGIGVAMFFMPLTSIIISGLDAKDIANASSLSNCTLHRVVPRHHHVGTAGSPAPRPAHRVHQPVQPGGAARAQPAHADGPLAGTGQGLGRQRNHAARVPARIQRAVLAGVHSLHRAGRAGLAVHTHQQENPVGGRMAQQTKCRKKTEARREAILDAALEEFAAKGYAGARMEDIARRAGVAKGTLYLHFGDKEGLFNGLAESAFAPMHSLAKEILDDKTPTLREKLLRFCGPMLDEQGCSRTARIIRLVWAEGLHNPKLVAPFYHGLVAPILELHRENLRLAAHEHPHPALQRFPQLLVSPIMQGLLWQGMFKDKAPLDVKELYIAYLDIILPEK